MANFLQQGQKMEKFDYGMLRTEISYEHSVDIAVPSDVYDLAPMEDI